MDRARLRSGPSGNVVVMIDRPAGAVKAALSPLMKRLAMSRGAGVDESAEERGEGEDSQGHQEDLAPAQQVGGAAAEQQQAAVAEDVAADDPLQGRGGQAEVGADGRQGHADHGHVQGVEEHRGAEHEQGAPQPGCPAHLGPHFRCGSGERRGHGTGDYMQLHPMQAH